MTRVALATAPSYPDLAPDDQLLLPAFAALGVEAAPVCWDAPGYDWSAPDLVLVRSCWDYHHRPAEFHRWLDTLAASGATVWNPVSLMHWNTDKRYLFALEAAGIAVPPAVALELAARPRLQEVLAAQGWRDAVVKPAVGASADGIWRTSRDSAGADQVRLDAQLACGAALLQPFLPEVATAGELSLMYIDGTFSHAVRKLPAAGDFRVQAALGGRSERCEAPEVALEAAARVLQVLPQKTLYARVDLIETAAGPLLIELELVEPELFFRHAPGSADQLARAALRRLEDPDAV